MSLHPLLVGLMVWQGVSKRLHARLDVFDVVAIGGFPTLY